MRHKVIAVFKLQPNKAEEEIERCRDSESLLNTLKTFPGFISYEVIKISDDCIMTSQTWETKEHFQSAMPKAMDTHSSKIQSRENLVVAYLGYAGEVVHTNFE